MIPLTFLYDDYIYRPKLTEQKNPFEYIVPPPPPPQVGSEQKSSESLLINEKLEAINIFGQFWIVLASNWSGFSRKSCNQQ